MTAVLLWSNRGSGHRFSGSTIAGVNAWSLKHLGRDLLHLSQALAVRFAGVRLILRTISGDRLLVRERLFQAGLHIATVAFRLDPLRRRSHLSWVVVVPTARSTGAIKHILQNILLVMRDCGTAQITLEAALTHGGYVWATYGFLPESAAEWARLAVVLRAKFGAVAPHLSPLQVAAVDKLLSSPDRLALRAVAALNIPALGTTLGKHLLLGTAWNGELDLADQPSALIYFKRIGLMP